MVLKVKDLSLQNVKVANSNHEFYKTVYKKITKVIEKQHANGNTEAVYDIPLFPIDSPSTYNPSHCMRYCVEKLKRGGFEVITISNAIHITWGRKLKECVKKFAPKAVSDRDLRKSDVQKIPVVSSKMNGDVMHIQTKKAPEPLTAKLARLNARIAMKKTT